MTSGNNWQTSVMAGALALGMAWGGASAARAQESQNDAGARQAAQQDGQDQQGRRGRGQGRGQGGGGPAFARNPADAVEQMRAQVTELQLTDEQKTKLETVFKDSGKQAKTLATEVEGLQGRERNEKMRPFMADLREKVNGVLTEEQRQTLRKNQATRQARQMTDRYRRALADLGLTDEQKPKVEAVLADAEKRMTDAVAQGTPGAAGGGAASADGQGGGRRGGVMGEIAQDTRSKLNDILTDEQEQKLQETMRQGRGGQGRGQGGGRRGGGGGGGAGNQQ